MSAVENAQSHTDPKSVNKSFSTLTAGALDNIHKNTALSGSDRLSALNKDIIIVITIIILIIKHDY